MRVCRYLSASRRNRTQTKTPRELEHKVPVTYAVVEPSVASPTCGVISQSFVAALIVIISKRRAHGIDSHSHTKQSAYSSASVNTFFVVFFFKSFHGFKIFIFFFPILPKRFFIVGIQPRVGKLIQCFLRG